MPEIGVDPSVIEMDKEISQSEKERKKKAESEFVRAIESIDENFSLFSWGWSKPLKITRNEKTEYITLRIKSVGISEILEQLQAKAPVPPTISRVHKKDSDVVRQLGLKHDVLVKEIDEGDPSYQRAKREHENLVGKVILVNGLAYDFKKDGAYVLKGSDVSSPSEVVDFEVALDFVTKRLGITTSHFTTLLNDITELTSTRERVEDLG